MRRKDPKTKFWTTLTLVNLVAMICSISFYLQADSGSAQFVAAMVLVGVAFLLAIADAVSAIIVYS